MTKRPHSQLQSTFWVALEEIIIKEMKLLKPGIILNWIKSLCLEILQEPEILKLLIDDEQNSIYLW